MTASPSPTIKLPQRPISLAEAARFFKEIGAGPSRSTLSRDASAGNLNRCRDLKAGRARPRYRFDDLCSVYGIDPAAPRPAPAKRADRSTGHRSEHAVPSGPAVLAPESVAMLTQRIDGLAAAIDSVRTEVISAVRDLTEVRKRLQVKYDTENGLLRVRAETAEARLREAEALNGLTREISVVRQAVSRLDSRIS